jgi:type IV pilus assembly protein PilY1
MKQLLVDAKGNTPCCWDAGEKLKGLSQGDRQTAKIFTYVPSLAAGNRQQDFTVANWLYFQSLMRKSGTDCSEANFKDCVLGDYEVKALIQWTRGVVDDQAYPVGNTATTSGRWGGDPAEGPYRDRQGYLLGDIVYSTPVIVGPPPIASVTSADSNLVTSVSGATVDYSDGAQAFWDFRNYWVENPSGTTYQGRPKVAYVGANDGMLHAFLIARLTKDTDEWDYKCTAEGSYPACGAKLWSYIPSNLLGELYSLSRPNYGVECKHRTMVDLSPRAWDVFIKSDDCSACVTPPCPYPNARPSGCSDRCWRTIIIGGERGGGDTYFSVDVTDPLAPKVLWEYSALKNLAVPYDDAVSTKLALPFREKDDSTDTGLCPSDNWPDLSTGWPNSCFDSMYFKLKTLPMSWTRAVLGRVRIPSDVGFWRYVESTSAAANVFRDPPRPTLEKTDSFGPCDNKRHIAFIGTAFQSFDDPSTSPVPSPSPFPDTVKSALVKPYLLALDVETGENYFQVLWPLAMKARTDAGLLPDRDSVDTRTQGLIPWAFGNPTLVDVWDNQDQEMTDTYPAPATADRFAEDGYVDRLYMGDMRGFFYRMSLNLKGNATHKGMNVEFWPTKPLPSELTPTNLATCDQTNGYRGCRQPITVAPAISYELGSTATDWPKLRVLFGTGKFDKVVGTGGSGDDKTDKTKMSFYNLLDDIRSFNCRTVSGAKVCDGLPAIAPNASFGIDDPNVYPAGVSATGANPEKGFLMTGANFGLTFGEGTCPNDRDTTTKYDHTRSCGPDSGQEATTGCDSPTMTRLCGQLSGAELTDCESNCKMLANRDVCCNWLKSATEPDCCQGSNCNTDVCSGVPEKCTPCWNCIYDFGTPGERVIGDPLIAFGLVYFTTYIPETTECSAGGHGWLYVLDYRCLPLDSGYNPINNPFARTVHQVGQSGARVDLGTGMPSEPVMDSTGQFVFVQKSDATVVKIGVPGGPDDGGGGSSFKDIQFKGWNRK